MYSSRVLITMQVEEIREILNKEIPGMGKVTVDLVVRDLGINPENPTSEEIKELINTALSRLKLFVGEARAREIIPKLASFLPGGASDITIT